MKKINTKLVQFLETHIVHLILGLAIVLSISSFAYYYSQELITAYGDSRGHLNIARRVIDSTTPGAAQFGGYWLPLLHLLMLATVWNDFMWQSGISGSIPNMIAYVVSALFLYKLVHSVTKSSFSGFVAAFILMTNINLLYMQTTPMTESLFIATFIISIYYLHKWALSRSVSDLIISAAFFCLSTLNRYESWLTVTAGIFVLVINWVNERFSKKAESSVLVFSTLALFGVFAWLIWGLVIFGDPLEFMHNTLSAGQQTKVTFIDRNMTGKGDLYLATMANIYATIHVVGYLVSFIGIVGLLLFLKRNYKVLLQVNVAWVFILLTPFIFEIITVFTGKVPVEVPELSRMDYPYNHFNIRYAVYTIPALAFFISSISKGRRFLALTLFVVIVNVAVMLPIGNKQIIVLKDLGAQPYSKSVEDTIKWFKKNYDGRQILASTGSTDKYMFETGIHQRNFITEGSNKYWQPSMKNPGQYADWVFISLSNERDNVYREVNQDKLYEQFEIVSKNEEFSIMKKKL